MPKYSSFMTRRPLGLLLVLLVALCTAATLPAIGQDKDKDGEAKKDVQDKKKEAKAPSTPHKVDLPAKLLELEVAFMKEREAVLKNLGDKEKALKDTAAKARDEWFKAVRDKDKDAQKKAKDAWEAADKEASGVRSLHMEVQRRHILGASYPPAKVAEKKSPGDRLGVQVTKPDKSLADQLGLDKGTGQVIVLVAPGSPADKAGLKVNDILIKLDGQPVSDSVADYRKALDKIKGGAGVDAVVLRQAKQQTIQGIILTPTAPAADSAPAKAAEVKRNKLENTPEQPKTPDQPK